MDHRLIEGLMEVIAPLIREYVDKQVAPLRADLAEYKAREPLKGDPGKDADPVEVARLVEVEVAKAVGAIELPADGKSVTVDDVRPLLEEMVASLPKPQNGKDADPVQVANLLVDLMPVPADGKSVTMDDVRPMLEQMVAAIPVPVNGKDADPDEVRLLVEAEVAKAVGAIEVPKDGKDVDPAEVEMLVRLVVGEEIKINPPKDGKDADPEFIKTLVSEQVEAAFAAIAPPQDGKSVTLDDVRPLVEEVVKTAVAEIPQAEPGKDADPAVVKAMVVEEVSRAVAELPKPENGKDADPAVIAEMVEAAVKAIEPPKDGKDGKDGVGLAGALIGRDGDLVVTLTDGTTKDLGVVVGRDADMDAIETRIKSLVDAIPRPKDGLDGVGFDDLDVTHDGERKVTLRFARGDNVKEFSVDLPGFIDRGVWKEGKYAKGDGVTWGGCFYIAQKETADKDKPGTCDSWRMSTKKGRDGQDGRPAKGILDVLINADGHLVVVFTDGTKKDVGKVVGKDGKSWV